MNWEIEYAQKQGKRIVGVWAHGEKGCDIPEALDEYHDAIVGWTGNRLAPRITRVVASRQRGPFHPPAEPVPWERDKDCPAWMNMLALRARIQTGCSLRGHRFFRNFCFSET
uniref:MTH538 TIR-like domain (DUF1863) n=1 Tax=Candidatus Kentrum eta TaxID=2126337 RepID=A0A450U8X9_9GAMM|nr:MAG: MTH538 TIR-like domain (DUF1863) [Candidatus Kentron sp. H]VFJ93530.1 MAG: MTH538 TIR-like domain (DUF1863) [Candidatus Kentron sp. H]VFJ94861.1 MAG: MTH538 TIR-like domain (DUF1863) [Candidatus Kentron sp. H]